MGCYINPKTETKEAFLEREGHPILSSGAKITSVTHTDVIEKLYPVCLMDNGNFTAAGVGYNEREIKDLLFDDGRPKRWFLVPLDKLKEVSPIEIYLKW